jgi:hypothetical protein
MIEVGRVDHVAGSSCWFVGFLFGDIVVIEDSEDVVQVCMRARARQEPRE